MAVETFKRVTCDLEGCGFTTDDPAAHSKFVNLTATVAEGGAQVVGVYCSKEHAQESLNALPAEGANPG